MPINYWLKFGDTPLGYGSGGLSYASSQRYMRIQVGEGVNPTTWTWRSDVTLSQVASDTWDVMWTGNADQLCANMAILHVLESNFEGVTSASELFSGCTSLTSAVLSNTGGIQNMYRMFYNCTSLTSAPMFDTSGATSMRTMFSECSNLVSVPLYDTGNVTDMQYMFDRNKALTTVPLLDTSKVTNMQRMFRECGSLQRIPLFNTARVTNVTEAFFKCFYVEGGALALYNQMSTQTTPPASHSSCFRYCGSYTTTGRSELGYIPSDWK